MTCSLSGSNLYFNVDRRLPSGTYLFGVEYTSKTSTHNISSYIYFYVKWTAPTSNFGVGAALADPQTTTTKQLWLDLNNYHTSKSSGSFIGGTSTITYFPWVLYGSNSGNSLSISANKTILNINVPKISVSCVAKGTGTPVKVNGTTITSNAVAVATNMYRIPLLSAIASFTAFLTALNSGFTIGFK
jgi:hypothetical protein